jgi:hypothetical protein
MFRASLISVYESIQRSYMSCRIDTINTIRNTHSSLASALHDVSSAYHAAMFDAYIMCSAPKGSKKRADFSAIVLTRILISSSHITMELRTPHACRDMLGSAHSHSGITCPCCYESILTWTPCCYESTRTKRPCIGHTVVP